LTVVAALFAIVAAGGANAGEVLDRVRRDRVVRCVAEERPVVAMQRPDGGIEGLAVEFCRAAAIAVLGSTGRVTVSIGAPEVKADVAFAGEGDVTGPGWHSGS